MSNLAVRTHFSLGQSTLRPEKIVNAIKDSGYDVVAFCDKNSLSSMSDIIKSCDKHELDYIVGTSLTFFEIADEKVKSKPIFELKFFVQNETGLKNLFKLISLSETPSRFYYVGRLQPSDLTEEALEGLLVTTGDLMSLFSYPHYMKVVKDLINVLGDRFFVELCAVKQPYFTKLNKMGVELLENSNCNSIVTRPNLYERDKADTRDIAQSVITNTDHSSIFAAKPYTRTFHTLSKETFEKLVDKYEFRKYHKEDEFRSLCTYKWQKLEMSLPKLAEDEFGEIVKLCKKGWKLRSTKPCFGETLNPAKQDEYKARLKYELGIIKYMGFNAYFLLVSYVVQYSKSNEIVVGPARGSAAGSLVAYLLEITDVDPLRFGLIFERFLNPSRMDYPDVDLDFMSSRRGEVIQHLIERFGEDKVAGIANYNGLASASALRDVARVSQIPAYEYSCSKLVPKEHGNSVDLETACEQVTEIGNYALAHPKQWQQSLDLQGVIRGMSQHAAGIVVAGEPIINRASVSTRKEYAVVNWDKRVVEDWGLIKLDILGLSTLDIISIATKKLKAQNIDLDLWTIPLDDAQTLDLFAKGRTKGIFQFEGGVARGLCRDIAVSGNFNFNDIVAINALNRPGPLDAGLTEKYVKIRQGKLFKEFPHPKTESALDETEGVIIYQEQVMQIARDLCGFTMAEADVLRKAIGKKSADLMSTTREQFVSGAIANSMLEIDAVNLFDQIELFAGYSFNKSHAVSYSLISYMAAYLKAHHSAEFYAASMSILDDEKVKLIAKEATQDGLIVLPPDINKSSAIFESYYDSARQKNVLYSPLTAVKNVSIKVCEHILQVRGTLVDGFESYQHFFDSVEARKCNKTSKANLDMVGAFSEIEVTQLHSLHADRLRDQKELMGALAVQDVKPETVIDMSPYLQNEILKLYARIQDEGEDVVMPNFGKKPKFVVITDKPTFFELDEKKSFTGKSNLYIKRALATAGLKPSQGYFTHLIKVKPDEKEISKEEIALYGSYLREELALLRSPIVILAGTKTLRYFYPDVKGSAEELTGTVEYNKDEDANYVFCLNPQMIYVKPEKQETLNTLFETIAELLD